MALLILLLNLSFAEIQVSYQYENGTYEANGIKSELKYDTFELAYQSYYETFVWGLEVGYSSNGTDMTIINAGANLGLFTKLDNFKIKGLYHLGITSWQESTNSGTQGDVGVYHSASLTLFYKSVFIGVKIGFETYSNNELEFDYTSQGILVGFEF